MAALYLKNRSVSNPELRPNPQRDCDVQSAGITKEEICTAIRHSGYRATETKRRFSLMKRRATPWHAAKMGNDSRRGLMTKSNKTVTFPYLPVRWSQANVFCPKGAVRNVAHTFAAQFMVRFQATSNRAVYFKIVTRKVIQGELWCSP